MCGRYATTLPPEAVRQFLQTTGELPNWPAYLNAAPTTALPVVRQNKEGQRELALTGIGVTGIGVRVNFGDGPLHGDAERSLPNQSRPGACLDC